MNVPKCQLCKVTVRIEMTAGFSQAAAVMPGAKNVVVLVRSLCTVSVFLCLSTIGGLQCENVC